jgi:hypothetical protein
VVALDAEKTYETGAPSKATPSSINIEAICMKDLVSLIKYIFRGGDGFDCMV